MKQCFNASHRWWWVIYTWKRAEPGNKTRRPYTCNSWRCTGIRTEVDPKTGLLREVNPCARLDAAVTFARIKEAATPLAGDGWVFFVLTLDREGYYSGKRFTDVTAAFRGLGNATHRFLTRLRGMQKRYGWTFTKNQWVSVVEAHRTGWPHVNLMVWCPELANDLRAERQRLLDLGRSEREAILVHEELRVHAEASGFGRQSTAEGARSRDALIGYVTKLAGHGMGASVGELAKITQAPLKAPERFRRLRAGKCFLPPRRKNPDITGTLVRRSYDHTGNPHVQPLHTSKPHAVQENAMCCYHEERLWIADLSMPAVIANRALGEARPLVSTFKRRLPKEESG